MSLIKKTLDNGLIQAGTFSEEREFQIWDLSTKKILARIEREWDNLGREPNPGEIVWFITTEKGDKEANRLQSGE
ncbi:hypothetical protein [Spirulina sp. 06S082]|uniref:hypothetical protein n=1 Tax=Spirulina sp. 06S082 TaxID=3110248 RepID=UPI002B1F0061|nr:hypothetical protein [Spirulina sp. 06S082]MEA5471832.1 hypothetical protein [Spirulina sp. 06S082]